ncbi:Glycosyl transferase family 2 [Ruminococcaceae bacterium YRB3002]|nr:Glycosyl transferase family 2 [Ruminococcaceae bacterium YRB3002]
MKVSIIIPFYNSESYLDRCIGSAIRQTYDDIEIILVNDGSADDSEEICRSYAVKDKRIRLINRENGGVSLARNDGLDAAGGELISFIDSDDYVDDDYIEYLIGLMEQSGSDLVCCKHEDSKAGEDGMRTLVTTEECLKVYLTSNEIFASVWGKLYRRELFEGIRFPEGRRFEDNYVLYKVIDRCNSIAVGNLRKYHYTLHHGSFVNEPFSTRQMDIVDAMNLQRGFIEQKYPSLLPYANSLVVYAANRCLVKMADSGICDKECIDMIRPIYRKYGKDFLKGTSGRKAKLFFRVARISPVLAMRLYRLFRK